jgi:N-acetylglucosamine kinase-like BadF-type ATPase
MGYVMGVDGGGSKTICLAADTQCRLLGYGYGGPVNTNYVQCHIAVESLQQAIQAALTQSGLRGDQIDRLCISAPAEPGVIADAMKTSGIQHVIRAAEGDTPRWAARFWISEYVGVTVDAGTGSLARGWSRDGRVASAGGWGGTLGDEGSGYWISLQAMRAVLHAQDGRIEPTILTQMVLEHFGMSDVLDLVFRATQGLVKPDHPNRFGVAPDSGMRHESEEEPAGGLRFREFSHHETLSRDEVASLCPVVVQAAQQGDWKAIEILKNAGEELAQLGIAVIKHLGMETDEFAIVPFGGVFRSGDWVLRSFQKTVLSSAGRASVVMPRFEPVVGAVLLALNDCGVGLSSGILEMLECTSFNFPTCRISQRGD